MNSDEARIKRYFAEFFRENRQWMARQRLIEKRRELTAEAKRLYDAGKLKQAEVKLRQAERIHAKLLNQLLSPTARKAPRARGDAAAPARNAKRKKSSRSPLKPSRR